MTINVGSKPSETGHSAQARARAREAEPETDHGGAQFRWAQAIAPKLLGGALSGDSLWHATPPSLAELWEHHSRSAGYFQAGLLRWPRYLIGSVHLVITAVVYLAAWVTDSPPKAVIAGAVIGTGFWLHIL